MGRFDRRIEDGPDLIQHVSPPKEPCPNCEKGWPGKIILTDGKGNCQEWGRPVREGGRITGGESPPPDVEEAPKTQAATLPVWVKILPLGNIRIASSTELFTVDKESLGLVVTAFRERGVDLAVDYGLRPFSAAAGWIKKLEARPRGLWAQVDWTQQAKDSLTKKEYRYFSPILRLDPETRKPVALLHVGLTNTQTMKVVDAEFNPRHENATGKKLCGMCQYRASSHEGFNWRWFCSNTDLPHICPAPGGNCSEFLEKPCNPRPTQPKPARLVIPEGVRFCYFGRPRAGNRHHGVMTVAYSVSTKLKMIEVGFSFCSPKDPWVKAKGQALALQRLREEVITLCYLYEPRRLVVQLAQALMDHDRVALVGVIGRSGLARCGHLIPGWSKNLAVRLGKHSKRPLYVTEHSGIGPIISLTLPIMLRMLADIAKLDK